jgi:hypothetical protein
MLRHKWGWVKLVALRLLGGFLRLTRLSTAEWLSASLILATLFVILTAAVLVPWSPSVGPVLLGCVVAFLLAEAATVAILYPLAECDLGQVTDSLRAELAVLGEWRRILSERKRWRQQYALLLAARSAKAEYDRACQEHRLLIENERRQSRGVLPGDRTEILMRPRKRRRPRAEDGEGEDYRHGRARDWEEENAAYRRMRRREERERGQEEERERGREAAHGLGVAGFVCGLLALVFVCMPCLWVVGVPLGLIGLILSAVSASRSGFGVAGLVLSLIALALVYMAVSIVNELLQTIHL